MTRGISPCFYKQRYEEYINYATKIDVWADCIDECQSIWIAWRKPMTMKNTRGEFEGGRQPHLNKKWPSSRTAIYYSLLLGYPR